MPSRKEGLRRSKHHLPWIADVAQNCHLMLLVNGNDYISSAVSINISESYAKWSDAYGDIDTGIEVLAIARRRLAD